MTLKEKVTNRNLQKLKRMKEKEFYERSNRRQTMKENNVMLERRSS